MNAEADWVVWPAVAIAGAGASSQSTGAHGTRAPFQIWQPSIYGRSRLRGRGLRYVDPLGGGRDDDRVAGGARGGYVGTYGGVGQSTGPSMATGSVRLVSQAQLGA